MALTLPDTLFRCCCSVTYGDGRVKTLSCGTEVLFSNLVIAFPGDLYLVVRGLQFERVQTLLQLLVHAARQLTPLRDLPAEGVVVLDQTQDVAPVAVGPHPVARHQAGGGAVDAVAGAAAERAPVHLRGSARFLI